MHHKDALGFTWVLHVHTVCRQVCKCVAHGPSLFHWLSRKVQRLLWVYGRGILMYEHVGEQVHVLHAVDGPHAPPILTILHANSHSKEKRKEE